MLREAAICALMTAALVTAGCGGSDDSASDEDTAAIEGLVTKLNAATSEKNASEFCLIMQPSAVDETFHGIDQCVRETRPILKSAGEQPELKVESVEVDGDVARVQISGSVGDEAIFVREGGQWYVPLNTRDVVDGTSESDGGES